MSEKLKHTLILGRAEGKGLQRYIDMINQLQAGLEDVTEQRDELAECLEEYIEALEWYATDDVHSLSLERINDLRTKARDALAAIKERK